jgi:hypothetical protein
MLESVEQLYLAAFPSGVADASLMEEPLMSLVALSHTPVEHRLYEEMLAQARAGNPGAGDFSIRRLMALTGIHNHSTVSGGRNGLLPGLLMPERI